jgi:acyl carrier protein
MENLDVITMFNRVATQVEKSKKLPEFKREDKITGLGIDSVSMMEVIGVIEDELDIKIPDEKLAQLQTVGDIEKVVLEQVGNA